jgi:YbbR domain-containing protein
MMRSDRTTFILALVLALFLWAYARMTQESPLTNRLLRQVPVTVMGKAASGVEYRIDQRDRLIDLRVKGPSSLVNSLTNADLQAKVDIAGLEKPGKFRLPVSVTLPRDVELGQHPPKVVVTVIPLVQRTFPVTISFIASPKPGATVGEYVTQPDTIIVEGPQVELDQVAYVTVAVDPNQSHVAERELVPRALNALGERVDGVRVLTSTVTVRMATLTGQTATRQVAIRPPQLINPPRGYTVSVARVRPDVVTLRGEPSLLDRQPAYLETEPLDVRKVTRDGSKTVRVKAPRGLTVVEGTDIRVDLEVQPAE